MTRQSTRCAIYARYSSENQREASIEDQVRICRARAEHEGWTVEAVHTDYAVSGATTLRAGYQALLGDLQTRRIDVVLCESLDRLSRDQEHIASFYKQASFAGVRIVTLIEGEASELHIGLKGTMGALYLKDLADKTRRGLEGRVRQGRSAGGLSYGYRVVRGPMRQDGESERGLREIEPSQAAIILRIFREFAEGHSPIAIARRLNQEQIPGPRGGLWSEGAIRGQARIGTGILRNRLYIGELSWNRRRWLKDPATGRRVARQNDAAHFITDQVPDLRIIEQALWDRVQARLQRVARPECSPIARDAKAALWHHRRPRHLLSGKIVCGVCGASYAAIGRDYLACPTAERRGPCANTARVRRGQLEGPVLEALQGGLMQPEAVAAFVASFTTEWTRLAAEATAGLDAKRRELDGVQRKLTGLIEAIADGLRAAGLQGRLDELAARKAMLEATLAGPSPALPSLHPRLPDLYREHVGRLRKALATGGGPEALEAARALIERIEVYPPATGTKTPRIELVGHLTALLRAAGAMPADNGKNPLAVANGPDVFLSSESGDAGTGFEPVTFRL